MGTTIEFQLNDEYIELFKLIKAMRIASSGGIAKMMIEEGEIYLNGTQEHRKRAKIVKGDKIGYQNLTITII